MFLVDMEGTWPLHHEYLLLAAPIRDIPVALGACVRVGRTTVGEVEKVLDSVL